ncbi:hypothetical protein LB505_008496 [Fusarium chuoi]|nr:hypothetical protein LB505_008496 [Fusarium chuoi]
MVDTSYLAQQVNNSIAQLHGLFDEIGVPDHDREARESEHCLKHSIAKYDWSIQKRRRWSTRQRRSSP